MKNLFFFLLLCLFATNLLAQPNIEWEKSLGGTNNETTFKIINTLDGGFLVGSLTESNNGDVSGNHGSADIWLTKIDNNGIIQWQNCLGGLDFEVVVGMDNTNDGGYILVGNTFSNGGKNTSQVYGNHGGQDIWAVKVDQFGNMEWRHCYGGCAQDDARAIQQTSDGNYVIVGGTLSVNSGDVYGVHGDWDAWALKIGRDGALIWQNVIGGSGIDYFYTLEETNTGNLIVGGLTSSFDGDLNGGDNKGEEDVWVAQLSADGDLLWNQTYGGSSYDGARGMCLSTEGDILIAGVTYSSDGDVTGWHGGNDAWVLRLDADGNLLWESAFGGSSNETAYSVFQRTDNDFIFAGEATSFDGDVIGNHGGVESWIVKFDKNGLLKTSICLGGSSADLSRSATQGIDNSVIVGGTSASTDGDVSFNHGLSDAWIVKLSVPLGLKPEAPNNEALAMELSPNPASNLVKILTNVVGLKKLDIFDESGKLIQALEMDQPEKSLHINTLPAGIYRVKMTTQTGQVLSAQFVKA